MTKNKEYQDIVFELSDGRLIAAKVPVFFMVGDPAISVREVRVGLPQELPKDCYWEETDTKEESWK
jgi:hypothetical protein